MNTLKNDVNVDFTIIPNLLINFEELSWKAKGIFAYLASKPDDWTFYMSDIEKRATDGKAAVQTGIAELEDHGFLKREQTRAKDGTLSDFQWTIGVPDSLNDGPVPISRQRKNPSTDKPSDGKPVDGKTVRRKIGSHSNTNNTKTKNSNTDSTKTESTHARETPEKKHPLQVGIENSCPNIQKIRDQLQYDQAVKLVDEFGLDLVMEKIEGLENKKDAPKKYTSVYLTLRSWCRMKIEKQPSNRQSNDKNRTIATAHKAFEIGVD